MTTETMLILGALGLLLLGVLALLFRKADPAALQAIAALQSGQDRLVQQLAALPGEMKLELAERLAALSREMSGFTIEQTRLLNAGLLDQKTALATQETTLLRRLAEQREQAATQMEALRRDTTQAGVDLRALLTTADAARAEKLAEGIATLRRDQGLAHAEVKQSLETIRTTLAETAAQQRQALNEDMLRTRDLLDLRLKELRESNEQKLAEIQKSVNEQLQTAVEKQMNESFSRVIDQFTAVQKAMGDVQAVTGQIGDIKRLFSNVKTRGGWGETQVRLLLDDLLPAGSYETNVRLSPDSAEVVEFAVHMPMQGGEKVLLAIDAKFPIEDYERLILAAEAGDVEAERLSRRALEQRVRAEAAKIGGKYIRPPATVEFAVLYLPTDGLYAEIARIPGAIEEIGRLHKVLVLGPSILPALLRTIQLGYITLALSQKADLVRELLGATKTEMQKMEEVFERLGRNVGTLGNTIRSAQTRTRAVARKLRRIDALPNDRVDQVLEIATELAEEEEEEAAAFDGLSPEERES